MLSNFHLFVINIFFGVLLFFASLSAVIPVFRSIDELILVLSFIIVLVYGGIGLMYGKVYSWFIFLILYFLVQLINYFASPFDLNIIYVFLQSIISIKLFLGMLLVYILLRERIVIKKYVDFIWWAMIFIFISGVLLNWVFGEAWNLYFTDRVRYRFGVIRSIGIFSDVAVNGYFFSLFLITSFFIFKKRVANLVSSKTLFLFTLINFLASLILTVRKNLISVLAVFLSFFRERRTYGRLFFSFLIMVLFFLVMSISYYFGAFDDLFLAFLEDDTSYIRVLMFINGFKLMFEFFPFGVGAGTFGTFMSNFNTLEVYEYVGINLRHYVNSDGSLRGVYDSGFSSFIAENGFVGLMVIIGLVISINSSFRNLFSISNYKIYYILVVFTLGLTFSEPICQSGFYTVFLMINLLKINFSAHFEK